MNRNRPMQSAFLGEESHFDIYDASELAYENVASREGHFAEIPPHKRFCKVISGIVIDDLQGRGYSVQEVHSPGLQYHYYVALWLQHLAVRVLIDPTYQQNVDEELLTPESPKVLIGTHEEILATARLQGFYDSARQHYPPDDKAYSL